MSSAEEISRIAERLGTIAARLREDDLGEAEADKLAREAADLAGQAGNELERALRATTDQRE
jgi:hypothetical protein